MTGREHAEGLKDILDRLRRLNALKPITAALKLAAAHVMGYLQKYPNRANANNFVRARGKFKTDKQRRFFFYALKKGLIEVPYRRGQSPGSRNLKQQWKIVKENPLRMAVENATPYGMWVQSAKDQTFFHRNTGWPTDTEAAEEARPVLELEIKRVVQGTLDGEVIDE